MADILTDAEHEATYTHNGGRNPAVPLLVSVFMILFSFFVVLNSASKHEKGKVSAAVGSVRDKFDEPLRVRPTPEQGVLKNGTVPGRNEFVDDVQGAFNGILPEIPHRFPAAGGTVLEMDVPASRLFAPGGTSLDGKDVDAFIRAVKAVLTRQVQDSQRELHVYIHVAGNLPNGDDPLAQPDILRAGAIVRALVQQGVTPESLSAGIAAGDPDTIKFSFDLVPLGHEKLTFADLAEAPKPQGGSDGF